MSEHSNYLDSELPQQTMDAVTTQVSSQSPQVTPSRPNLTSIEKRLDRVERQTVTIMKELRTLSTFLTKYVTLTAKSTQRSESKELRNLVSTLPTLQNVATSPCVVNIDNSSSDRNSDVEELDLEPCTSEVVLETNPIIEQPEIEILPIVEEPDGKTAEYSISDQVESVSNKDSVPNILPATVSDKRKALMADDIPKASDSSAQHTFKTVTAAEVELTVDQDEDTSAEVVVASMESTPIRSRKGKKRRVRSIFSTRKKKRNQQEKSTKTENQSVSISSGQTNKQSINRNSTNSSRANSKGYQPADSSGSPVILSGSQLLEQLISTVGIEIEESFEDSPVELYVNSSRVSTDEPKYGVLIDDTVFIGATTNDPFPVAKADYDCVYTQSRGNVNVFVLKLMDFVFSREEIRTSTVKGGVALTKMGQIMKNKLEPSKMNAILAQLEIEYPGAMNEVPRRKAIRRAVNNKCRRLFLEDLHKFPIPKVNNNYLGEFTRRK